MGWSIGYDDTNKRDVGYGVPAVCEHPDCSESIDRGMSFACGGGFPSDGCGRYFCISHGGGWQCSACKAGTDAHPLKPDTREWLTHKLTDSSWARWRNEKPEEVRQAHTALETAP